MSHPQTTDLSIFKDFPPALLGECFVASIQAQAIPDELIIARAGGENSPLSIAAEAVNKRADHITDKFKQVVPMYRDLLAVSHGSTRQCGISSPVYGKDVEGLVQKCTDATSSISGLFGSDGELDNERGAEKAVALFDMAPTIIKRLHASLHAVDSKLAEASVGLVLSTHRDAARLANIPALLGVTDY
ncbi:hypothetical protein CC80DRAFT_549500 [Byssothecium circinans]|uniref:Uncharacterized protein n=1 Tax=Byssothecium circinans TaxID=147558 RepID=A0A6A5TSP1_9PLEO|nr:hypothetical protein CC80DRAFT_549500 [Byssothecium circinans]